MKPHPPRSHSAESLARLTLQHVTVFVIAAAWMFGGKIYWATLPLSLWGTAGAALTVLGFIQRRRSGRSNKRPLLWLTPGLLLGAWILTSSFNPSFKVSLYYDQTVFLPITSLGWLPSAALPSAARSELWLFMGLYLAGFNVALNFDRPRQLHRLFLILALNTTVIAVFGTIQKFARTEMFFGLQASPNTAFFGSFIYHNHWGPFALIGIAMWLAVLPRLAAASGDRGFSQSPAPGALVAALLIAIGIPLSTSRASTLMLTVYATVSLMAYGWRIWRDGRRHGHSALGPLLGILAVSALAAGAIFWVGETTIIQRFNTTQQQLTKMTSEGSIGERMTVYRTTVDIWLQRPWAGWGLESWPLLHSRNTPLTHRGDHLPIIYDQAHSDWLQSLAETGAVGTLFLLGMGALPLWSCRRQVLKHRFTCQVLGALALIVAYAWIEFPLANPAVVLAFWVSFFGALRYAQLGPNP